MPITVLFAEDSEGYAHLLDHASAQGNDAAGEGAVVAWDEHTPRATTGRELLNLLNAPDADPPDVVLVDDWMSWDGTEPVRQNAVRLVGAVTRMLGERRPKLVLWTGRQDEPWLRRFAFLSYGGHQVSLKNEPGDAVARTLQVIREVHGGMTHRHAADVKPRASPPWPPVGTNEQRSVVARNLDYIAALHAARRLEDAASLMNLSSTAGIDKAKQKVANALGRDGENWTVDRTCQEALRAGWLWVPPAEWPHCPFSSSRRAGAMQRPRQNDHDD